VAINELPRTEGPEIATKYYSTWHSCDAEGGRGGQRESQARGSFGLCLTVPRYGKGDDLVGLG
jgi:hypothetical protein